MTDKTALSYPHLVSTDTHGAWQVEPGTVENAATSPESRWLRVPLPRLKEDMAVELHELQHVAFGRWGADYPKLPAARLLIRKMLEEVRCDAECLAKGLDTRSRHDTLNWDRVTPATKPIEAAAWLLQLAYTNRKEAPAGLQRFYTDCIDTLSADQWAVVAEAIHSVSEDRTRGNCDYWSDRIMEQFLEHEGEITPPDGGEASDEEGESSGSEAGSGTHSSSGDEDEEEDSDTGDGPADDEDLAGESEPSHGHPGATAGLDDGTGMSSGPERDTGPRYTPTEGFSGDLDFLEPMLPDDTLEADIARADIAEADAEREAARKAADRKRGEASLASELDIHSPYGKIDLHRHTLDRAATHQIALTWRSSESGQVVKYPHRLYPSGRVFAARMQGGSMVIDFSGSMAWDYKLFAEAMEEMPRLWVIAYSMHRDHANDYMWGTHKGGAFAEDPLIRAQAMKGRYVARVCLLGANGSLSREVNLHNEPEMTGGNGDADKAALWYAARFAPKPLVWVSDGQVDAETINNQPDTNRLMFKHQIVRVREIEEAIKYLRGEYVMAHTTCLGPRKRFRRGSVFTQEATPARRW